MKCTSMREGSSVNSFFLAYFTFFAGERERVREDQLLTTSSTVLCTHTLEEIRREERGAEGKAMANKAVNLTTPHIPSSYGKPHK